MTKKIQLKGITWGHSRGFVPMVATAQRYQELHPDVEIVWKKRTLQEFADKSITELAEEYDLLVIDHPWTGHAAANNMVVPFDDYLPASYLEDQRKNSVGQSYKSYNFFEKQWALPIDAATPVAASRPDLLEKIGEARPANFEELLALARKGYVGFSLLPIDLLMAFYGFCHSLGESTCQYPNIVVGNQIGEEALRRMKSLVDCLNPSFYTKNPFMVFEDMTQRDEIAYCPFAYGYSNYARQGYARKTLHFHDLIDLEPGKPLITTLGGAGLAVSSQSKFVDTAVDYAQYVCSKEIQSTIYVENGGQPGHLQAWKNERVNAMTANFFVDTLPALERAYLRPRYYGHMYFQDHAGQVIVDFLHGTLVETEVLQTLNDLYLKSISMEEANGK